MYSGYMSGSHIHLQVVLFIVVSKPSGQVQGIKLMLTVNLDGSASLQGLSAYRVSNSSSSGDMIEYVTLVHSALINPFSLSTSIL